jgi:hypothetical protein
MNYKKAIKILSIDESRINYSVIKRNYYIQALKHHPDKNNDSEESKIKFQEITQAYTFLKEYERNDYKNHCNNKNNNENTDNYMFDLDYKNLFKQFLSSLDGNDCFSLYDINELLVLFNKNYINSLNKIMNVCSKEKLIIFYDYLQKYNDFLIEKDTNILSILEEVIKNKLKNDERIILNPSIINLFNDDIYKLDYNGELYYIPLWHNELIYDINDSSLFIECIPDLDDNISIDDDNNLVIKCIFEFKNIIYKKTLEIMVGEKVFNIPVNELKIKEKQFYKFYNCGISLIDHTNIYNVSKKSNIIVDLTLV